MVFAAHTLEDGVLEALLQVELLVLLEELLLVGEEQAGLGEQRVAEGQRGALRAGQRAPVDPGLGHLGIGDRTHIDTVGYGVGRASRTGPSARACAPAPSRAGGHLTAAAPGLLLEGLHLTVDVGGAGGRRELTVDDGQGGAKGQGGRQHVVGEGQPVVRCGPCPQLGLCRHARPVLEGKERGRHC